MYNNWRTYKEQGDVQDSEAWWDSAQAYEQNVVTKKNEKIHEECKFHEEKN